MVRQKINRFCWPITRQFVFIVSEGGGGWFFGRPLRVPLGWGFSCCACPAVVVGVLVSWVGVSSGLVSKEIVCVAQSRRVTWFCGGGGEGQFGGSSVALFENPVGVHLVG